MDTVARSCKSRSAEFGNTAFSCPSCRERKLSWNNHRTRRLFQAYRETGDPSIRDEIFSEYTNLVDYLAKQYSGKGVDYEDLHQEGCLGLLTAIERFDLSRGIQFSTFAPYYIKGRIWQYFRNKAWPCSVPREYKEMSLRIRDLADKLGREPTRQEIVNEGNIPPNKVEKAIAATKVWEPVCLYKASAPGDLNPAVLHSVSCMDPNIEAATNQIAIQSVAKRVLSTEEANVIHLYYYEELSQKEIAQSLGTYQMMVSRILQKGTDKLGRALLQNEQKVS